MRSRRMLAAALAVVGAMSVGAAAACAVLPARQQPAAAPSPARDVPLFRFVSIPDFLNADVGNTRLRAGQGWDPGDPNSINGHWREAVDTIVGDIAAEHPAFVLDSGDLVNGHWWADSENTGIFGPMSTRPEQLQAVDAAAQLYYGYLARQFARRGLTLYPGIGDHDIGDNPWPAGSLALDEVAARKRAFARQFTRTAAGTPRFRMHPLGPSAGTAYALRFGTTLVITVDEFERRPYGVALTLDPAQLRWLSRVLVAAGARRTDHVIVQGHLPVLGSTGHPIPSTHSSRQFLAGRADSPFWTLLRHHHVDLYLAGEMHLVSFREDGVAQLVAGGLPGLGWESYTVGTVYRDRIVLRVKAIPGTVEGDTRLWQLSGGRPYAYPVFAGRPRVVAVHTVYSDR